MTEHTVPIFAGFTPAQVKQLALKAKDRPNDRHYISAAGCFTDDALQARMELFLLPPGAIIWVVDLALMRAEPTRDCTAVLFLNELPED